MLALGGSGLLWLLAAGLVVLRLDAEGALGTVEVPPTQGVLHTDPPGEPAASPLTAPPPPDPRFTVEALEGKRELDALADLVSATHVGLEELEARFDPGYGPYVERLVERLNGLGQVYAVRITAPDAGVARRRAERTRELLLQAGLRPWLLDASGAAGPKGVAVERP